MRVLFKGCKVTPYICTTPGLKEGELETVPLEGRAVWENEQAHKTALDLIPPAARKSSLNLPAARPSPWRFAVPCSSTLRLTR